MDTGEKLINISQLVDNYSQEHIAATLALHAFTGADCTSAFKGKVRPMTLLSQNSQYVNIPNFRPELFFWPPEGKRPRVESGHYKLAMAHGIGYQEIIVKKT